MVVLKFGGSSVGQPGRFKTAVTIVKKYRASGLQPVIIASALSGVTDRLVQAATDCNEAAFDQEAFLHWMLERHTTHASLVLSEAAQNRFSEILAEYIRSLLEILNAIKDTGNERTRAAQKDALLAIGERLSVRLFALALSDAGIEAGPVDADTLIQTDASFGAATVHFAETYAAIQAWYGALDKDTLPVVTGFIGRAPDGRTTTLGRGGSDYSASILAAGLRAHRLERWTDVDGVYTSDPRLDPNARRLDYIIMEEALSWNKAGKMGLHRKTLDPLIEARVPLFVRSIDTPAKSGTMVSTKCRIQSAA